MKIKNGFFYKALKDLKCGDKVVFTKGRRYLALKNNALHGDDSVSYAFPPSRHLIDFFEED